MRLNRVIRKRLRGKGLAGEVNATIAANVGEPGGRTKVSSKQRSTVVQRGGKTVVDETTTDR
jgi:hypothetical protein